ncbi:MAG: acyltransferase [Candidatus Omnitrophota bacterium]|jgi:galactoside O-acetyltransferase|nr:MAG: acyltransferase [Candidatus Omnitrophota bacterium]
MNERLFMQELKSLGEGAIIYPMAKIIKPEVIEIGPYCKIDDFTFIYGGNGIRIGRYVHIASFVSIIGGGVLEVGDYTAIAAGARLITGTDTYKGGARMSAALPLEQRSVQLMRIIIGKDAFIGTSAVVHPGITIGEGAIIGSCSLVLKDCEPWTIYAGVPCKPIGKRPKVNRSDI